MKTTLKLILLGSILVISCFVSFIAGQRSSLLMHAINNSVEFTDIAAAARKGENQRILTKCDHFTDSSISLFQRYSGVEGLLVFSKDYLNDLFKSDRPNIKEGIAYSSNFVSKYVQQYPDAAIKPQQIAYINSHQEK